MAAVVLLAAACGRKDSGDRPAEVGAKHDAAARPTDPPPPPADAPALVALPPAPPLPTVPAGLPPLPDAVTSSVTPEAVALGELLFFDPRLAADGRTACSTCHDPAHDYAGRIDATVASERNARRTPALANLAWHKRFGWDGRYATLADLLPVHVRGQQGNELADAIGRLADIPAYRAHLARVGGTPAGDAAVAALAAFALTRYDGDSPWDRVEDAARRPQPGATVDDVTAGYLLFVGKARCGACHTPPLYTDLGYHRVRPGTAFDAGRGKVEPGKRGAFATPTLRGAANRTTLFHDAAAHDLDAAVALYVAAGSAAAGSAGSDEPPLDDAIAGIQLAPREVAQLVAFLRALSAPPAPAPHPVLPSVAP
jgi:cytochrome c peroxidase